MKESKVIELNLPEETGKDILTEMIRKGAQKILKEALEVKIEAFMDHFRGLRTSEGCHSSYRHIWDEYDGGLSIKASMDTLDSISRP